MSATADVPRETSPRPTGTILFTACAAVLVVAALGHLALWTYHAHHSLSRGTLYPDRFLWRAIISIGLVGVIVAYSLYAGLLRRWIHGLCIYATVSGLLLCDCGYRDMYWYFMLPTFTAVETLFLLPAFTKDSRSWYPHLLRAHFVLLPACIVSGLLVGSSLPPSPVSKAPTVLAWITSSFFALNALNLLLARLIAKRPPMWSYAAGGLEALVVLLVSGGYALLVMSFAGA